MAAKSLWKTFGQVSAFADAESDRVGGRLARGALMEWLQPCLCKESLAPESP